MTTYTTTTTSCCHMVESRVVREKPPSPPPPNPPNYDAMTEDVKLSRQCCRLPWGLRLSGGVDFMFPLTVVRMTVGGLAEKAGLKAGDVVIKLNGEPLTHLPHAEAHERLVGAGNEFVLSVVRGHVLNRLTKKHEEEET